MLQLKKTRTGVCVKIFEVAEQTDGNYRIKGNTQGNYVDFIVPSRVGIKFMPKKKSRELSYWINVWCEEPPRYEQILFLVAEMDAHIGYVEGDGNFKNCTFVSESCEECFRCDDTAEASCIVTHWFPVPEITKNEDEPCG